MRTAFLLAELLCAAFSLSGCGFFDSPAPAAPVKREPTPAAEAAYRSELEKLTAASDTTHEKLDTIIDILNPDVEAAEPTPAETIGEIDIPVQAIVVPPLPAAPEVAPQPTPSPPAAAPRSVVVNGQSLAFDGFVKQHYRGKWSHPGTIDTHLIGPNHKVAPESLKGLTDAEKEKLHSALHEAEESKSVTRSRSVVKGPAVAVPAPRASTTVPMNCPNGQCPAMGQPAYRYGLFGRLKTRRR